MSWNCVNNEERLSDYLDGLLAVDERRAFETHAQSCANCSALLAGVRGLVAGMHRLEMTEPPQGLIYRILSETTGKEAATGRKSGLAWLPAFFQPKLALGALTVFATLGIVLQATGVDVRRMSKADLNPISVFRATNRQAHLTYARGVKFVNDLRVVYEIQSRLQTSSPATSPAVSPRRDQSQRPAPPEGDRQLKNQFDQNDQNDQYGQSGAAALTAALFCSLPASTDRGATR